MSRQSWEDYFFSILDQVQLRATCDRGKCGCLIVSKSNNIVSTGYVGSLPGRPHCDEVGHELKSIQHSNGNITQHCTRTIHAEQNAICLAAKLGISLDNCIAYTTICPCKSCAQMLITSGIQTVYFKYYYSNYDGLLELLKSNISTIDYDQTTGKYQSVSYLWNSTYPSNEHLFFQENSTYLKSRQIKY